MTNEINVNQDLVIFPPGTVCNGGQSVNSPDQDNPYWQGCAIFFNITALGGTGVSLQLQFKDPATGQYIAFFNENVTTSGMHMWTIWGSGGTGNPFLTRTWRFEISPEDNNAYTFSLGCSLVR